MYEFLVSNPIIAIVFIVLVLAFAVFVFIKAMQKIGLDKIRLYAYKWFEDAENEFQHGENTQKFEYVVQLARSALPLPFSLFITEGLLRRMVQLWFDVCKDLLDDGKFNGTSVEAGTEE